jgi:hypothetical protein
MPVRAILGNIEGLLARVRIGAILHPAVLFAFANRTGFMQYGDCPSAQRLDRRPPLLGHQH